MEDISIEQRKFFLNREKELELQAIYYPLLTTLSNRTSLFSNFNSNFKICFCSKLWNFLYMLARDNDSLMMVVKCFSFDS